MPKFLVQSTASAHTFGVYDGIDGDRAISAMLADAGVSPPDADPDIAATELANLHGRMAICAWEHDPSLVLCKREDPTEGAREGISRSDAYEMCSENPRLVYVRC